MGACWECLCFLRAADVDTMPGAGAAPETKASRLRMKEGTQKEARALKGIVYQLNILLSFLICKFWNVDIREKL